MNVKLSLHPVILMRDVPTHTEVLSVLVTPGSPVMDGHVQVRLKFPFVEGNCEPIDRETPHNISILRYQ